MISADTLDTLQKLDNTAYFFARQHLVFSGLDPFMFFLSSSWVWWILALGLVWGAAKTRSVALLGLTLQLATAVGLGDAFSTYLLKKFINRPRPCYEHGHLRRADVQCGSFLGTPSNHAVNTMAVVGVLAVSRFHRFLGLAVAIAIAVSWSRLHLGVHYPGDLLLGWLVGLIIGIGVGLLSRMAPSAGKLQRLKLHLRRPKAARHSLRSHD